MSTVEYATSLSMLLQRRDRIVYLVMFTALLPLTALIACFLYFPESGRSSPLRSFLGVSQG